MNRRTFLKRVAVVAGGFAGVGTAGYAYGRFEATWFHVVEATIAVPRLPPSFDGLRVALLTDPHHGRFNSLEYIASAVDLVNALAPDLVALGGDFAHGPHGRRYLVPCLLPSSARLNAAARPLRRARQPRLLRQHHRSPAGHVGGRHDRPDQPRRLAGAGRATACGWAAWTT